MSLNKADLVEKLGDLFDAAAESTADKATAKASFTNGLATIIDDYVKSATIVYTTGLTITNVGYVTGVFQGELQ